MFFWPQLALNTVGAKAQNTIGAKAQNTGGGQCWKNNKWPTSQKPEVVNAGNTGGPHNEGRPSAAFGGRHHVVTHYVVRQYFHHWFLFWGHWPRLVFPALASASTLGFGPYCVLGFDPYCILGFGPYCIKGRLF